MISRYFNIWTGTSSESEEGNFGLYVVKETGETRRIGETEFPLLLRWIICFCRSLYLQTSPPIEGRGIPADTYPLGEILRKKGREKDKI
jgi:hypothetical protein